MPRGHSLPHSESWATPARHFEKTFQQRGLERIRQTLYMKGWGRLVSLAVWKSQNHREVSRSNSQDFILYEICQRIVELINPNRDTVWRVEQNAAKKNMFLAVSQIERWPVWENHLNWLVGSCSSTEAASWISLGCWPLEQLLISSIINEQIYDQMRSCPLPASSYHGFCWLTRLEDSGSNWIPGCFHFSGSSTSLFDIIRALPKKSRKFHKSSTAWCNPCDSDTARLPIVWNSIWIPSSTTNEPLVEKYV